MRDLQSAAARVVQADRALRTGIITLNGTVEGLEQTSRFGDVLVLITPAAGGRLRAPALEEGLRRVLHDGGRVQPGAVRTVPRAGLPGPRGCTFRASRRGCPGGHDAAALPSPSRQWATTGYTMNGRATERGQG